jgi:hypothetical protein
MSGNILDSYFQVESTLPEMREDWSFGLGTASKPSEDSEE